MKLRVRPRGPLSRAEREALALLWEREARRRGGPRLPPGSMVPCPEADGRMVPAGADYPGGRALACLAGRRELILGSSQRRARVRRDLRAMETARVRRSRPAELEGPAMPRRVAEVQRRGEMGAAWFSTTAPHVAAILEASRRAAAEKPARAERLRVTETDLRRANIAATEDRLSYDSRGRKIDDWGMGPWERRLLAMVRAQAARLDALKSAGASKDERRKREYTEEADEMARAILDIASGKSRV